MFINIHFPEMYNRLDSPKKTLGYLYGSTRHKCVADMIVAYCQEKAIEYQVEEWKGIFYFEFPDTDILGGAY